MRRSLLAAAVVFALPVAAFAQDASVLNGKDDVAFAKALVENGYPDLAERLLEVIQESGGHGGQAEAPIRATKLRTAYDAAMAIKDPVRRKDTLVKVLADTEKFIREFKGTDAAEDVRRSMPDLHQLIVEAFDAAIAGTKDTKVLEPLRSEADALFVRVEQEMTARIAELRALKEPTETDEMALKAALYNYPHTLYAHALLFPKGSARRVELCKAALTEYDEFDVTDPADNPPILCFYAYVDAGLCLNEIGQPDEAIKSIDKTIGLRESWGPTDESGRWPIPAEARDVVDLVCWATLQKMIVLREQKKFDDVAKTGRDYFASMRKPFAAPSSMLLAKELGNAQLATGDAVGAAATARSMIDEEPDGFGAHLGRELLGAAGK